MQAGVVALAVDERLHEKCAGCIRADWENDCCIGYTSPRAIWAKGKCWAWEDEELRVKKEAEREARYEARVIEEYESQFQQARFPGPWEDPLAWLSATHPPSIRDKEAILPMPAPAAKSGGSKSGRKRKNKKIIDLRKYVLS